MPSKNKRTAAAATVKDAKKPRIDPKLAAVTSALSNMEAIPKKCRDLLTAVLGPSLKVDSSSERHETQTAVLGMIEEAFEQESTRIKQLVSASEQKLASLMSVKESKDSEQAGAEATLDMCKEQGQTQKKLLEEASVAKHAAEQALAEAQAAKAEGGKTFEANKQLKDSLETAFADHYQTPMDNGDGPHFSAIQPLLCNLTLDESLLQALPSTCVKLKDQRGSFDTVVLEELRKAFTSKLAELAAALEAEGPAAAERDAKEQAAQSDLEAKTATSNEASNALDAAQKAVEEAQQEVAKATTTTKSAAADVQMEVHTCDGLKFQLSEFEKGPLATFVSLKEASPAENKVVDEVAPLVTVVAQALGA